MLRETCVRVHADFGCEGSTQLPTDAKNKHGACLWIVHQLLNTCRHLFEVKLGLLELIAHHKFAIEVLVDVVERTLRQVVYRLDFKHG